METKVEDGLEQFVMERLQRMAKRGDESSKVDAQAIKASCSRGRTLIRWLQQAAAAQGRWFVAAVVVVLRACSVQGPSMR